jgi:S1-C subfamily serine protease
MPAADQQNGDSSEARSKRKQPPTPSNERPMKQIKPETDAHARNGSYVAASPESPTHDQAPSPDTEMDIALDEMPALPVAGALHDTAEWQKTIEGVVRSVVSIHFCQTCSFDTDPAVASEATGFVVDAERGYILTNRVCTAITHSGTPC